MAEVFTAGVQYNDWKGTAAADDADNEGVQEYFRKHGLPEGAYIIAVRAYYLAVDPGKINVRGVYADGNGFDNVQKQLEAPDPLALKEIDIELALADFFKMFKRFNVVLPREGLNLDDREYNIQGQ